LSYTFEDIDVVW